ncbi:MAG: CPBP family intramembrane glutamic endopeptidase [Deinococcota bacterium]
MQQPVEQHLGEQGLEKQAFIRRLVSIPRVGVHPWLAAGFYGVLLIYVTTLNLASAWLVCIYAALALLMIVHASLDDKGALYGAMAILPAMQTATLLVRVETISQASWAVLLSYFVFVCILVVRRAFAYERHEVGLALAKKRSWGWLKRFSWGVLGLAVQLGVAVAGGIGLRELWQLYPESLILLELTDQTLLSVAVGLLFVTGVTEELYFRGLFQQAAKVSLGTVGGLVYPSLIAALVYTLLQSPLLGLFQFGVGLTLGVITLLTGSALGVAMARGLANISLIMSFTDLRLFLVEAGLNLAETTVNVISIARGMLDRFL